MDISYKIARTVSNVFVPPTFVVLSFVYLALSLNTNSIQKIYIIGTALLFGLILPVTFFIFLRIKKKVSDNDAFIKEQRTIPYLLGVVFCLVAAVLLYILADVPHVVINLWLCYVINMIGMLVINRYWKISAHAIGASVPLGLLLFCESILFVYLTLAVLIICWARLKLKMHTKAQVAAGVAYGLLYTYIQLYIYAKVF